MDHWLQHNDLGGISKFAAQLASKDEGAEGG